MKTKGWYRRQIDKILGSWRCWENQLCKKKIREVLERIFKERTPELSGRKLSYHHLHLKIALCGIDYISTLYARCFIYIKYNCTLTVAKAPNIPQLNSTLSIDWQIDSVTVITNWVVERFTLKPNFNEKVRILNSSRLQKSWWSKYFTYVRKDRNWPIIVFVKSWAFLKGPSLVVIFHSFEKLSLLKELFAKTAIGQWYGLL